MTAAVTDHALVRYLDRVLGWDVESIRAEIAAHAEPFVAARARTAQIGAWWLVLDGKTVVTCRNERPVMRDRHQRVAINGADKRGVPPHWKDKARKRRWR